MTQEIGKSRSEVVVVTGAAAGVGRATALEFGRHGARVALIARDRNLLEQAAEEIRQCGGTAMVLPIDVADSDRVQAAAADVEQKLGPIDIWVNNAMATVFSRFGEVSPEEYRRATEVTYLGAVWGTMAALKCMQMRDRGCIVQVGSALAYRSIPLQSAYCGAKAAIRGFTDSLRTELLHDHSRVHLTMVQLPAINTPQFDWCRSHMKYHPQPVPPIYDPALAARTIFWAAHQRRREIYLGLSTWLAIEGNKFLPQLLDRYLGRIGYSSQQTGERVSPDRPGNLFEPVQGDFAARGSFGDRASHGDVELWIAKHGALTGLILASLLGSAALTMLSRRRR